MTEEENPKKTTGKATLSGGAPGNSSGKRFHNGKAVLGKVDELGELVYKFNTRDQADSYIRTTEAIADYVGREYGYDMRVLVRTSTEKVFTQPVLPDKRGRTEHSVSEVNAHNAELNRYHKKLDKYYEDKGKVFIVILGQCTQTVKNKLDKSNDFKKLESDRDVAGLLAMLKEMAFSTKGVQEPYVTLADSLRRLTAINQGTGETVANYYKRFSAVAEVMTTQWGDFYPPKLAGGTAADDIAKSNDKLLARIFLTGSDKKRYGKLMEDLNNAYIGGKDNYPESLDATLNLLTHYQDYQVGYGKHMANSDDKLTMTSFAQKGKARQLDRIRCFKCNEYGHMKHDCPKRQHYQGDTDDDRSHGTGWAG
jgi:Zinc knuckle